MKERFSWRFVWSFPSSDEFVSAFTRSQNVFCVGSNQRRLPFCSARSLIGPSGKSELLAENAPDPSSADQATSLPEDGPTSPGASGQHGSELEPGAFPCPARDGSRAGTVSFSACFGSTHPRRARES